MSDFIDIDEDFDVDAELEGMEDDMLGADEMAEASEFEVMVVSLCGARMAENELIGRVETEDEVFAAVMQSPEIAQFMVSTGMIEKAEDHAARSEGALLIVNQLEESRAKEALTTNDIRIVLFEDVGEKAAFYTKCVQNLQVQNARGHDEAEEEFYKWMAKQAVDDDLKDITASYTNKGMPFLLALIDVKDDRGIEYEEVIGCVGLSNEGDYDPLGSIADTADNTRSRNKSKKSGNDVLHCELSRLSVQRHYRRHGVASKLVAAAEEKARSQGFAGMIASVFVAGGDANRDTDAAMALLLSGGSGNSNGARYSVDAQKEVPVADLLGHSSKKKRKKAGVGAGIVRYTLRKSLL